GPAPAPLPGVPAPRICCETMANAMTADGVLGLYRPTLSSHETLIRGLSDRLVEAQRPLRILDAVKWGDEVERAFFAADGNKLPQVTRDLYASRTLPFHPGKKREELRDIER